MKVKTQITIDESPVERKAGHGTKKFMTEVYEGIGRDNDNVAYVTHNGVVVATITACEDGTLNVQRANSAAWRLGA